MFVGPPFHAMPFARHVDYAASSVFINLTDTRKWFGKEKAQWHLNPRVQNKHKGKEGEQSIRRHKHVWKDRCTNAVQRCSYRLLCIFSAVVHRLQMIH